MQPHRAMIGVKLQLKREEGTTSLFKSDPLYNSRRRKPRAEYPKSEPIIQFPFLLDSTLELLRQVAEVNAFIDAQRI